MQNGQNGQTVRQVVFHYLVAGRHKPCLTVPVHKSSHTVDSARCCSSGRLRTLVILLINCLEKLPQEFFVVPERVACQRESVTATSGTILEDVETCRLKQLLRFIDRSSLGSNRSNSFLGRKVMKLLGWPSLARPS